MSYDDEANAGCGSYLLFAAAAVWVLAATVFAPLVAWVVDQFTLIMTDRPLPLWIWPVIALGLAVALLLPLLPLALVSRAPRLRAAYQTWVLAAALVPVFGLVRLFPPAWSQAAALAQIALSLLSAAALLALARLRGRLVAPDFGGLIPAVALAPLVAGPLLLWGALGDKREIGRAHV